MDDLSVHDRRPLGRTGIQVGPLSFGSAPLSTVFWGNDQTTAIATARRAVQAGIALFDTAPLYGLGEAEERLGLALADAPHVAIATKVGRTLADRDGRDVSFDFSAAATRRQLTASLERLGRDHVDIVHVHDPDDHLGEALDGCLPALAELRAEGAITAVSVGTTRCATALHFLEHADLDVLMLAGRLTLLDRSALDAVIPACARERVPLLAAGVFNSGVLARPSDDSWYDYAPVAADTLGRVRRLEQHCAEAGVTLRAAAMSFPLRFEPVASVVVGMASPAEVDEDVASLGSRIPDGLWDALDGEEP